MDKEEYKEFYESVYRHSLAHILAKAVIEIYGADKVQYAIGPQIADGFYYDFEIPVTIGTDDFKAIEDKMREIIKRREDWTCKELTREEALEQFKGQKFKTELINDLPEGEKLTCYWTGDDFVDLCRGPHVANSQELMNAAFQIRSVAGAYWRGDEHREQLQRVYVYAFTDKNGLKAHLQWIKEAQERDHKKIGTQLDLFMFDETAPGMPYWLPRGWKMYQALLAYSRQIQAEARLHRDLRAADQQEEAVADLRPLGPLPEQHVHGARHRGLLEGRRRDPRRAGKPHGRPGGDRHGEAPRGQPAVQPRRGRHHGRQAHELPQRHDDLQADAALLQGAAHPLQRI